MVWDEFRNLDQFGLDRLVIGDDLNVVWSTNDRSSNNSRLTTEMVEFNNIINELEWIDLRISGCQLTWSNFRLNPSLAKLDRVFVIVGWDDQWPTSKDHCISRITSDHMPLLFSSGDAIDWGSRPFKFESMRLEFEGFEGLFRGWWEAAA